MGVVSCTVTSGMVSCLTILQSNLIMPTLLNLGNCNTESLGPANLVRCLECRKIPRVNNAIYGVRCHVNNRLLTSRPEIGRG
jgi:hypothetical protein